MCLIISQCPFLATLLRTVSHLRQDTPTILLPQFSPSTVKSPLALVCTGQCYLSQDCDVKELKQIIEVVGFKVGTGDLEIVKVEDVFNDMNEAASNEKTMIGTNDETKIEYEIEIELKQEPVDVSCAVPLLSSSLDGDLTAAVDGPAEKDFCDISTRTEVIGELMGRGQLHTVNAADGGPSQSLPEA